MGILYSKISMNAYIEKHKERFLEELKELLKIESVSTDPVRAPSVRAAAAFVAQRLQEAGADGVRIMETDGHPVVYAEKIIDPKLPTILVYGHYDVQPEDPIAEWDTPAFEPTVRNGKIFARGATDDKGQMYIHVKALETMLAEKTLPCNAKFMIEGEEEMGSPSLASFCKKNKKLLKADVVLVSDTSIVSENVPGIQVGLRGLVYFQIDVYAANTDLHSGLFGGAVPNPLTALSRILGTLHDAQGCIAVKGLYKEVRSLSRGERRALNAVPHSDTAYMKLLGLKALSGEKGFTTIERTTIRPALDINGMWGGFTGEGSKTVLPREAHAKVSIRLVPDQDPAVISRLFKEHITRVTPPGVRVEVRQKDGVGKPFIMDTNHIGYQAAARALKETFKKEPLPLRSGGSIPIIALFEEILGLKSVMLGFGLPTDNLHAPNEHFSIKNFYRGIETVPRFYHHFTELFVQSKRR